MAEMRREQQRVAVEAPSEQPRPEFVENDHAQELLNKHMSRWSVLLDRLK